MTTIQPDNGTGEEQIFVERAECISCSASSLEVLSTGTYADEPLHTFILEDPWGESPMPYIREERWEFVRCRQCQQMFHKWILNSTWMETLFTQWMTGDAIREFEERHRINEPWRVFENTRTVVRHVLRLEKMTRSLRDGDALRVIDFGCGWGRFLAVAALFGAEAYGIDRDQDRREGAVPMGVKIVPTLDDLDAGLIGKFHAITAFQVMEHLEDPLSVLQVLYEWMAPDGVLILETPNCQGVTGFNSQSDYRAINPLSHINAYTADSLAQLAMRAGFDVTTAIPAHATAEPIAVVKTELKRVGGRFLRPTTNLYFRRT